MKYLISIGLGLCGLALSTCTSSEANDRESREAARPTLMQVHRDFGRKNIADYDHAIQYFARALGAPGEPADAYRQPRQRSMMWSDGNNFVVVQELDAGKASVYVGSTYGR